MKEYVIPHRWNKKPCWKGVAESLAKAVEVAVKADANLVGADLENANLEGANLKGANLEGANLEGAYLGTVPVVSDLHKKMEEVTRNPESFNMKDWHTCETTHCRAGWATILAGKEGKELEEKFGSAVAGTLIYHASTGMVPDFYATTEESREDIERCAKETEDKVQVL